MENKNGQGIFYGVIGVATLVVAIIGATFAYFSASVTPTDSDAIQGTTNGDVAGAMTLQVKKVAWTGTTAASNDLVPADFNAADTAFSPANLGTTEIGRALTAKCEKEGYTGCHVWRITATTTQTVAHANILLTLEEPTLTVEESTSADQWAYAVFTATEVMDETDDTKTTSLSSPALAAVPTGSSAVGSFGSGITELDIHNNAQLTAATAPDVSQTYYLLIYVNNDNTVQNEGGTSTADVTGSYSGSVTMKAAGGQVMASFAS